MNERMLEIKEVLDKVYNWETELLNDIYAEDLIDITIDWFKHYQWDEDSKKMMDLYEKLIDEEWNETVNAWRNKDIVEVLDWICDYVWVTTWYIYFWHKNVEEKDRVEERDLVRNAARQLVLRSAWAFIPFDLFKVAYLEVAYSNWTKSLEKRKEDDPEWKVWKVIKWENFVKPDLNRVFDLFANK